MRDSGSVDPRHIAVIMDGNGRWAERQGKPRIFGHRRGVEVVRDVTDVCGRRGIEYLTLFAFSSENWHRPKEEVRLLTELLFSTMKSEARRLLENGVRLRVIGDLAPFGKKVQKVVYETEKLTEENDSLNLTIAVNYGGRWDISQACREIVSKAKDGLLNCDDISETALENHLSTAVLPDLDLFIRTGGEIRISNFFLWQLAYAELYFTDTLWPDFDEASLEEALASYKRRQRRFGTIYTHEQEVG